MRNSVTLTTKKSLLVMECPNIGPKSSPHYVDRHEMYCNIDKLVKSSEIDAMEIHQSIVEVNSELRESGYDYIDSLPSSVGDYIEIDSIDYIYEIEDLPSDDDEREKYLSEKYDEIYEQWSTVNNNIETYLLSIDKKYGTKWCPTGKQRML